MKSFLPKDRFVGEGERYAETLKDTESAIKFFIRHYGKKESLEDLLNRFRWEDD